jgi:hypothetical protein
VKTNGQLDPVERRVRDVPALKNSVLTPDLKEFIDRAIVPALVGEYLEQGKKEKSVAPASTSMDNLARTSHSAEESTV